MLHALAVYPSLCIMQAYHHIARTTGDVTVLSTLRNGQGYSGSRIQHKRRTAVDRIQIRTSHSKKSQVISKERV